MDTIKLPSRSALSFLRVVELTRGELGAIMPSVNKNNIEDQGFNRWCNVAPSTDSSQAVGDFSQMADLVPSPPDLVWRSLLVVTNFGKLAPRVHAWKGHFREARVSSLFSDYGVAL